MDKNNLAVSEVNPIELYKQLLALLETDRIAKNWERIKIPMIKRQCDERNQFLKGKNHRIQTLTRDMMNSKPDKLEEFLRKNKKIYEICKNKKTGDIIDTLENVVFTKRKKIDKLTSELVKVKEDYYILQKDLWFAKQSSAKAGKNAFRDMANVQEKEAELESIKTERDAGLIILNSYKKLLDLMNRESEHFDKIVNRLKTMIILRATVTLHLLELLKWSTYDRKALKEIDKILMYVQSEVAFKQAKEMKDIKSVFSNAKTVEFSEKSIEVTQDKSIVEEQQLRQYSKTLHHIKEQWEEVFAKLKDICRAEDDRQITVSIEHALQDRHYLERLIDITHVQLDNYAKRKDYLQQTLDDLTYSLPDYIAEYSKSYINMRHREQGEELDRENKELKKELEEIKDASKYLDTEEIREMYNTMFHFQELLKNICIQPYETFARNQEILRKYKKTLSDHTERTKTGSASKVVITEVKDDDAKKTEEAKTEIKCETYDDENFSISQRVREKEFPGDFTDPYVPPHKFDYLEDEYRISHVFDGIYLKVKLMLQQLGNDPEAIYKAPAKEELDAYRKYALQSSAVKYEDRQPIESESEEEGESEEARELERVLFSLWSRGGKSNIKN